MDNIKAASQFTSFLRKREEFVKLCHERAMSRRKILENLRGIFREYKIKKAYIFGSTQEISCLPDS
ncbi:hypothetical protein ACFL7M_12470, partial [Thermodesulfobacteriota bacterium]